MRFSTAHSTPQYQFANETSTQRAKHREIAHRYRQRKRLHPKTNVRIAELGRFLVDRYGPELPNDDAGAEDALLMLHHLAHRANPEQRMRYWLQQRAPSFSKGLANRLITKTMRQPLKFKADTLAKLLRLDAATRQRLGITTIGAIDCKKAKRKTRRRKIAATRERERRAKAGAKPHAASLAQTEPWKLLKISRATYFRRGLNETVETDSCAAHTEYVEVVTIQSQGAPPPQGGVLARAVTALPAGDAPIATETVTERVFATAAREAISISISSSM
jgi:hypothetical protein